VLRTPQKLITNHFIDLLALKIEYKSGDNPFKGKKNELNARQIAKKRPIK
jgi:GTP-binding protein